MELQAAIEVGNRRGNNSPGATDRTARGEDSAGTLGEASVGWVVGLGRGRDEADVLSVVSRDAGTDASFPVVVSMGV